MRLIRRLFLLTCFLATCAALWAAIHARREGFSSSWRNAIEREFEKRGYYVEIGKLTLGAFRGLVAEDVRFFQDQRRTQELAFIDDVYLDVDLSRIFEKKIPINTLDVQEASISLPLDSEKPRRLRVTGLSGRVVVTESVIEIVKAEASVAGVDLSIKGSLIRQSLDEDERRKHVTVADEKALRNRQRQFARLLREFEHYEFKGGRPNVAVEFRGDLEDLSTLTASAKITTPAFRKTGQTYGVDSLDAVIHFDGRENQAEIEHLHLRDHKGSLDLTGRWQQEGNRLDFSVNSTANLQGVAALFTSDKKLGEVVFFTPPTVNASGTLDLNALRAGASGFPGEVIGELRSERFVTRGTVFAGIKFGFSLAQDRVYLRNLRLDHKTGVAFLNLKYEPDQGDQAIQYQTEIKLDPLVFRPFFNEQGRKFIDAWNFEENSSVYIAATGQGSDWSFASWKNRGMIDLREFRLNGVDFQALETEYESDGDLQWFRNAALVREEGKIVAELAENNRRTKRWEVKGVVSTVDPIEGAKAFNPKLAVALEKYRHATPPTILIDGLLDGRREEEVGGEPRRNELAISFSGTGTTQYDFLGKTLTLTNPVGEVKVDGSHVHLSSLTGEIFGGKIKLDYDVANVREPNAPFVMKTSIRGVPLEAVTKHYGESDAAKGKVDAEFRIAGHAGQVPSFHGEGTARITNGHLFAIPVLGALTPLITGGDQNKEANNIAKEASASFIVEEGVIKTRDFEALTKAFRVKVAGSVSLVDQSVDLEAVVNTRGELSSTVLTPVSELLTYSCTGTWREPVWKPKHISNLGKVPASIISEMTNIPVEGLKKLGQLGQEIFLLPERLVAPTVPAIQGVGAGARAAIPRTRRIQWGGNKENDGEEKESLIQPRRLFQKK